MIKGFKEFIMKGNVVDLAVAVVIGGAFGTVVTSLVNNIIMPLIAGIVGKPSFNDVLKFQIGADPSNFIEIGTFITVVLNFLIIALAIYFVVVVPMNHMIARRNAKLGITAEEDAPDPQVVLLTEIRDALKARN
ncbi:large conductance mechanosensitive channel protein MscL [Psychromicrobium lacuslunae]|uniref:Large-conductance mechanosensitive channel n=1 Tax=Psychromicrobium lacuslunae TaxID=1618207 RepID=A0A0D4BZ11_9MICC|nr:large conductance mechanosensitive channel protein MscL [Psychromicrobium lacuslunae]AJT41677.1 mechanosensitive ion channel protein MscL [Psychromicrobium lacuslunae]